MYKKLLTLTLSLSLLTSCSYRQYNGVVTGGQLGGVFGSAIGGIMGGQRGSDKGTVIGILAGGAIGAIATQPKEQQPVIVSEPDDIDAPQNSKNQTYALRQLQIDSLYFVNQHGGSDIIPGEKGTLFIEFYNRSSQTLENVMPLLSCEQRKIKIAPPATVLNIAPQAGIRYRADILCKKHIKNKEATFKVQFDAAQPPQYFKVKIQ